MPKILLISPLSDRYNGIGNFGAPALGVWRLKGNLEARGHGCDVWDCNVGFQLPVFPREANEDPDRRHEETIKAFCEDIERRHDVDSYDWIGFSILNDTLVLTLGLAHLLKQKHPLVRQVAGNSEATLNYQDILDKSRIDCVLVGESDLVIHKLLEGEDPRKIEGCIWFTRGHRQSPEEFYASYKPMDFSKIPYHDYWRASARLYPGFEAFLDKWVTEGKVDYGLVPQMDPPAAFQKLRELCTVRIVTMDHCFLPCVYCFCPGTLVSSDLGFTPIEALVRERNTTRVMQANGSVGRIKNRFERTYDGDMVRIRTRRMGLELTVTPNHKIHVKTSSGKAKKPAGDLLVTDKVFVPYASGELASEIDVEALLAEIGQRVQKIGDEVRLYLGKTRIPARILWSRKLVRLLGLYAAEGSTSAASGRPNSVNLVFTFSKEGENHLIEEVQSSIREIFGQVAYITNQDTSTQVQTGSSIVAHFFRALCGYGSQFKRFHRFIQILPRELFLEFAAAYFQGDGYYGDARKDGSRNGAQVTTISPSLAFGTWLGLARAGVASSLIKMDRAGVGLVEGRPVQTQDAYRVRVLDTEAGRAFGRLAFGDVYAPPDESKGASWDADEKGVYLPIEYLALETYRGPVFNLEVEETHTYTANGIAVDNCSTARVPDFATGKFQRSVFLPIKACAELFLQIKRQVPGVLTIYDDSDETFLGTKRGYEYAEMLLSIKKEMDAGLGCPFRYLVQTRTNEMTRGLVLKLAEAGVSHLTFGIENASEYVRDSLRKRQDSQQILDIIGWCNEAGITCYYLLILFPPETRLEDVRTNVTVIREWIRKGATVSAEPYLMPYKGTPILEEPDYYYEHVTYSIPFSGTVKKRLKWPTLMWPKDPAVRAIMEFFRKTIDDAVAKAKKAAGHSHTFKGFTGKVCVEHLAFCLELFDKGIIKPQEGFSSDEGQIHAVYQDYGDQASGLDVKNEARMQSARGRWNPTHSSIDGLKQGGIKTRSAKDPAAPDEPILDIHT